MAHQAHHRNTSSTPSSRPCPACGQDNRPGSHFCSQCGSPLAQGQAGNQSANQSPADQDRDWQRQRQWLWQEEQRLLGQIAQEQARFTARQATIALLEQQQQHQQQNQRPNVIGNIVVSALVGLHHSYAEQNYLYAMRMLEQDVLRQQYQLVEIASRLEGLNAALTRVRSDLLRLDALMGF